MQTPYAISQFALRGISLSALILSSVTSACAHTEKSIPAPEAPVKTSEHLLAPGTDIGMWVWRKQYVDDAQEREKLIQFCEKFGITRLFVQVRFDEVDGGYEFANVEAWNSLLTAANAANIKVDALDGEGSMGFDENRADTIKRLEAVLAFNQNQPAGAKLSGFHYDIEPYVTKRWKNGDHVAIAGELLETFQQIRSAVKASDPSLTVAHDIPFWYSNQAKYKITYKGSEKSLDQHIQDLSDFVGIMSYRTRMTGINSVAAISQEELEYASQINGKVYLSLETVTLKETPSITFHNKDPKLFADAIKELSDHMNGQAGFGGISIHCYRTAAPMLEAWAETKSK